MIKRPADNLSVFPSQAIAEENPILQQVLYLFFIPTGLIFPTKVDITCPSMDFSSKRVLCRTLDEHTWKQFRVQSRNNKW